MQVFNYQGHEIAFDFGDGQKMINATQMAKAFGKSPGYFLRNKEVKEYIAALENRFANLQSDQIIRIVNGGANPGTWMHKTLALRFAQWLSPEFALWVDERVEELLTTGSTALKPQSPASLIAQMANILVEQERVNAEHDARILELEAKSTTKDEHYYTISGYCRLAGRQISRTEAISLGKAATALSKERNYKVSQEYDAKYGSINAYHTDILKQIIQ